MSHSHAIVCMESRKAHVFRFSPDDIESQRIWSLNPFGKRDQDDLAAYILSLRPN
jgi:hypothetical protein